MDINKIFDFLKLHIKGEVYQDKLSLGIYSTDASIYQIKPLLVVIPKENDDILKTINIARENNLSIVPRGTGSSLNGQTIGKSIIIDFSKYMNQILEFNKDEKWIRVQPGIIHGELNKFLKTYNLHFAPDEATIDQAKVGGVIGNNSSGSRSLVFGKAIDHLLEAKVALTSGEIVTLGQVKKSELYSKSDINSHLSDITDTLVNIIDKDREEISKRFPKVMRRVSGYPLDEYLDDQNWNLAKIICGSEGTLATTLELKLNLETLPNHRGISLVQFDDRLEAIKYVPQILNHKPSAIELMDEEVIDVAKSNPSTASRSGFIDSKSKGILIVEFFGDNEEDIHSKHEFLKSNLSEINSVCSVTFYFENSSSFKDIWDVRKKGVGLLLSVKSEAKPIPFIEDLAIPVEHLHEYISKLLKFCDNLGVKIVLYAHASVGVLHVRPILNMHLQEDIDRMQKISEFALDCIIEYKGSWSGEHGDGISRSYGLQKFFGDKIYNDFRQLKSAFDPHGIMNPGKIVDPYQLTSHLRYGPDYKENTIETVYHYREEKGFSTLANMCNGVGACQKLSGGTMCPTYKATMDESASTRGRANAIRLTIAGELNEGKLENDDLMEILELCLSCKSCKTECPSNVDVAKMKSEILQKRYDNKGYGLKEFFIVYSDRLSSIFSGSLSYIINPIVKSIKFRKLLEFFTGFDARRILPSYAHKSLNHWVNKEFVPTGSGEKVIFFSDTYINHHEPEIGKSIISLLDKLDFQIKYLDLGDSKRPLISNGFLKKAKKAGEKIAEILKPYLDQNIPIIVVEPGSYSALADDIPDLIYDKVLADKLKKNVFSIEKFLANRIYDGRINIKFHSMLNHHIIHGHCHQKALEGIGYLETVLKNTEGSFEILDAGCCGMAGAFGYEKKHFSLSKKVFDNELKDKLSRYDDDTLILATGFSCRHQIRDFTNKKVKHWAEVVYV